MTPSPRSGDRPERAAHRPFDALDLPDWLGTEAVTWEATGLDVEQPVVTGQVAAGERRHDLDLLAADAAYPRITCSPQERHDAHQAWRFGEVLLVEVAGRVTAVVPGVGFDANLAVETLRRVAKALGAPAANFTVVFRL